MYAQYLRTKPKPGNKLIVAEGKGKGKLKEGSIVTVEKASFRGEIIIVEGNGPPHMRTWNANRFKPAYSETGVRPDEPDDMAPTEPYETLFMDLADQALDAPSGDEILVECLQIANLLLAKNAAYGNSALEPARIFSNTDAVEQIKVRLDDKISRLMRGLSDEDEDVELDLMGYLVLLRIARRRSKHKDGSD